MIKEGGWVNQQHFMESHGLSIYEPGDFDEAKLILDEYRQADAEAAGEYAHMEEYDEYEASPGYDEFKSASEHDGYRGGSGYAPRYADRHSAYQYDDFEEESDDGDLISADEDEDRIPVGTEYNYFEPKKAKQAYVEDDDESECGDGDGKAKCAGKGATDYYSDSDSVNDEIECGDDYIEAEDDEYIN